MELRQQTLAATAAHRSVVIVFGPPLPGRNALVRALVHRLPGARRIRAQAGAFPAERVARAVRSGHLPIVEGDFTSAADRKAARRAVILAGALPLFVAWLCDPDEARREIYHRYARLPTRYADSWWRSWEKDFLHRQALGEEIPSGELVGVGARGSRLDHLVRVASRLGLPGPLPATSPEPRRILVVDDDPDSLEMVAQTLETLGHDVLRARSAEEALLIATDEPLDLVLTDQQMPGESGTDLARRLGHLRPDVQVVLITGFAEESVADALDARGVRLLLAKPVAGGDLVRLLDDLGDPHAKE